MGAAGSVAGWDGGGGGGGGGGGDWRPLGLSVPCATRDFFGFLVQISLDIGESDAGCHTSRESKVEQVCSLKGDFVLCLRTTEFVCFLHDLGSKEF